MKRNGLLVILGIGLLISIGLLSGCDLSDASGTDTAEVSSELIEDVTKDPAQDTDSAEVSSELVEDVTKDPAQDTDTPTDEATSAEDGSAPAQTSPLPDAETTDSANSSDAPSSPMVMRGTIEDICTPKRVHNITSATYVGYEVSAAGNLLLTFDTVKNHTGLDMDSRFKTVYFPVDVFSTNPADIVFEQGRTYLLLLHRFRNVYSDGDEFQITTGSLIIPIDDFQSSTLHGAPLAQNVTGIKMTEATTVSDFITYLQTITADHPDFTGQDYIQTDNRSRIMAQSPHVVTVTTSSITSDMSILTVTVRCRVDAVHKGTLEKGAWIDVMFPLEADVKLDQTFILTLNDPMPAGMDWYMFSCKQAMYPLSELNEIESLIRDGQAAQ